MRLCNPIYRIHNWGRWNGLFNPGQPDAAPKHMARECHRCGWRQERMIK